MDRLLIIYYFLMAKKQRPQTLEALEVLKEKKLKSLLKRVAKTFPLYRKLGSHLSSWPTLSKQEYIERFHELNSQGLKISEAHKRAEENERTPSSASSIQLGLSSGTSGQRGVFMTDRFERSRWVGTVLAKCFSEEIKKGVVIAFFLRANNELYENSNNSSKVTLKYFGLQTPPEEAIDALNRLSPDILVAPPYVLAQLSQSPKLTISPKKVFSVADILDPWDEKIIRERFKCPLHQIYQATEGFLGVTCEKEVLHLNEDLVFFEKVNLGKGRFSTVISDFHRRTQAIVRLALTDVLIERKAPCECGSPLMAVHKIEGRMDEIFKLPSQENVFRSEFVLAIQNLSDIPDFRLTQNDYSSFTLELDKPHFKFEETIKTFIQDRGWRDFKFDVSLTLILHPWEKRRRFRRSF